MSNNEILEAIKGENRNEEPPRVTEGFESLITEKEFNAIEKIMEAVNDYVDVHNECTLASIDNIEESSTYARVQYLLLGDVVEDVLMGVRMMTGIHTCNKEFLDSLCEEKEMSLTELEKELQINKLKRVIFG